MAIISVSGRTCLSQKKNPLLLSVCKRIFSSFLLEEMKTKKIKFLFFFLRYHVCPQAPLQALSHYREHSRLEIDSLRAGTEIPQRLVRIPSVCVAIKSSCSTFDTPGGRAPRSSRRRLSFLHVATHSLGVLALKTGVDACASHQFQGRAP